MWGCQLMAFHPMQPVMVVRKVMKIFLHPLLPSRQHPRDLGPVWDPWPMATRCPYLQVVSMLPSAGSTQSWLDAPCLGGNVVPPMCQRR